MEIKKLICDNCGVEWLNKSSPIDAAYENSVIKIVEGSMLLPNLNIKNIPHSAALDGDYCCPDCLTEKIKKLLKDV